ncbi:MAG TPA: hypothetical protein VGM77_08100 [Gemmatimonadales bacterium]|jgi:hypothetical protein
MDVEGILAILLIFGGSALVGIAYSPIGRAIGERIRFGRHPLPAPELDPAVYEELDQLRTDVAELQERVDFAERLLAKPVDVKPEGEA